MPTFHRQLETRGTQVHRCVKTFLFLFLRKSQETKTLFTKTGRKHSLYVSALASRKGGWSGIRLAFSARVTHPETWFLPPFFLSFETTDTFGKGCFFISLQTLCESSEKPNPPVFKKRDPRTFPRFAVKKRECACSIPF